MRHAAIAAALAAMGAAAQEPPRPFEVRLEAQREDLDRGRADWREELLQLAWKPRKDLAFTAGVRETERFDLRDREGFAGASLPMGAGSVLRLEASGSSTHRVLARSSALAEATVPLQDGWVVAGGARLARYAAADVTVVTAAVDKYFGDYRVGYTAFVSRPEGAGWSSAHRIAASWSRDPLTFVTVSHARGREVESLPAGLVSTDVNGTSLAAGIALRPGWGLTLELGRVRQGDLYTRRGARLGTRILF